MNERIVTKLLEGGHMYVSGSKDGETITVWAVTITVSQATQPRRLEGS